MGTDPLTYARRAMEVWAYWWVHRHELGWASTSIEARAAEAAQTKTRTDGVARWKGEGEPPAMPKETRRHPVTIVPRMDGARLGPKVHRLLLDMCERGRGQHAAALQVDVLMGPKSLRARAEVLGVTPRHYTRLRRDGLKELALWLALDNGTSMS